MIDDVALKPLDAVIDLSPKVISPDAKSYGDISSSDITDLCTPMLKDLTTKFDELQSHKSKIRLSKYVLAGTQYLSKIGVAIGATTSAIGATTSQYPIYGVFIFAGVDMIGTFIRDVINPDKKTTELDSVILKIHKLREELTICQITKSLERFKDAQSKYSALMPCLI